MKTQDTTQKKSIKSSMSDTPINLPDIPDVGEIYLQGNKRFALLHVDGVLYRAAIKVTKDAEKMYLLTVFKTTEEKANKEVRRKSELVRSAP